MFVKELGYNMMAGKNGGLLLPLERKFNIKRFLLFLILLGVCGEGLKAFVFANNLTSNELFKIMLVSRDRIVSLQICLERKGYYSSEEKTENPVLMYQQQMEYRQQGEGTVNSLSHFS